MVVYNALEALPKITCLVSNSVELLRSFLCTNPVVEKVQTRHFLHRMSGNTWYSLSTAEIGNTIFPWCTQKSTYLTEFAQPTHSQVLMLMEVQRYKIFVRQEMSVKLPSVLQLDHCSGLQASSSVLADKRKFHELLKQQGSKSLEKQQ